MPPRRKRPLALAPQSERIDFTPESRRVLKAAAREVGRELGRQAAREQFEMLIRKQQAS
jgi:hypothetical protein